MKLILASQSPRRSELLTTAGFRFAVRPANIDESLLPGEQAEQYVQRLARSKALAAQQHSDELVLGADTVVTVDSEILGKPCSLEDAKRMLRFLRGRSHEVLTGVCLRRGQQTAEAVERTRVWFAPLSDQEMDWYVRTGEPMDKAGAYAIQGFASRFIEKIEGSYSNVVGLPVERVYQKLQEFETNLLESADLVKSL
jgi:septum formation protein